MTDQEVKAASLNLSFDNIDEAVGINVTQPGTIGIFKVKEAEYVESTDKKTPGLKCTFEEQGTNSSEFNHTFWLTGPALPRIQTLAKYAAGQKLTGSMSVANIIATVKGKNLPLKVTASINEKKGKVYPDLPFGGFSALTIGELAFNAKETADIERSKSVVEISNISNADAEQTTQGPGNQTSADDF